MVQHGTSTPGYTLLHENLGQGGFFTAKFCPMAAHGYQFRTFIEHGGDVCCSNHHLLRYAQVTPSGTALIWSCSLVYLPLDLTFQPQVLQLPHVLRQLCLFTMAL